MSDLDQLPLPAPDPSQAANVQRSIFPCACGMYRTLPEQVRVGDVVQMVPCPRCGAAPRLRYHGANVEQVDPASNPVTLEERRAV